MGVYMLELIERVVPKKPWMEGYTFILVQSLEQLQDIVNKAIASKLCSFDLESTGLDTRIFNGKCKSYVVGYSLCFEPKIGYYIPIRHGVENEKGFNLDPKKVNDLIQKLINECSIIGHNWLKFDAEMMWASENISLKENEVGKEFPHHDTYILARLAGKQPSGLKHLAKTLLNKEMLEITEIVASKANIDFSSVFPSEGLLYAASDAICTYELFQHPEIKDPITTQATIYAIERKLMKVVCKMERNKIKLNKEFCEQLDRELLGSISEIEKSMFKEVEEKTEGRIKQFQLDSPEEVSHILFDLYDMNPKPEKGKKGNYKTDDDVLEILAPNYPLAKKMQEYRTNTKFYRTYIKNMLLNVDEEGYLKFNFSSLRTDSGRFASPGKSDGGLHHDGYSGVNIQATPARYDVSKPNVRKCISCEDDEVIAALDWSGVEIRVATNLSKEPIWMDRFLKGDGDLHTTTAAIIFDKAESEITKEERQTGKTFNFQTVYGGGPGALAKATGISIDDARVKQGKYFGKLKVLQSWIKSTQREAEKKGYCLTAFGRKRLLPEFKSDIPKIRANALRKAVNTPVQGSSADLMKLAMINIDRYIEENKLDDKIQMLLTMHDELVFRLKKSNIHILEDIERVMKLDTIVKKIKWGVGLQVDVEVGSSWDVEYEYKDMLEFLIEKKGTDKVAYIYSKGADYPTIIKEYKEFKKSKKEAKKEIVPKQKKDVTAASTEDFKKIGETLKNKIDSVAEEKKEEKKEEVLSVSKEAENTASAQNVEEAFKILKEASLGDLPLEAYNKLKKSFCKEEFIRILEDAPSVHDGDVEFPIIVHNPIDKQKKINIGLIIDSCPGMGKVKFLTQDKEELHEGWLHLDVIKVAVMGKIFNL